MSASKKDKDRESGGSSSKKKVVGGSSGSGASSPDPDSAAPEPFVRQLMDYEAWKETLPVLYDCFIHSNLEWPSYACAWGPVLPEPLPGATNVAVAAPNTPTNAPTPPHLTAAALEPQLYPTSYVTQNFYFSRSTDSKLEKDKCQSPRMRRMMRASTRCFIVLT
jgi:hypothetical protein